MSSFIPCLKALNPLLILNSNLILFAGHLWRTYRTVFTLQKVSSANACIILPFLCLLLCLQGASGRPINWRVFAAPSVAAPCGAGGGVRWYADVFVREKPHVNVGTIGHVDHGKTTLTAAITKGKKG